MLNPSGLGWTRKNILKVKRGTYEPLRGKKLITNHSFARKQYCRCFGCFGLFCYRMRGHNKLGRDEVILAYDEGISCKWVQSQARLSYAERSRDSSKEKVRGIAVIVAACRWLRRYKEGGKEATGKECSCCQTKRQGRYVRQSAYKTTFHKWIGILHKESRRKFGDIRMFAYPCTRKFEQM